MSKADDLRELIEIHAARLAELKKQQAFFGAGADPSIGLEIKRIEAEIQTLQQDLEALAGPQTTAAAPRQAGNPAATPTGGTTGPPPAPPGPVQPVNPSLIIENPHNIDLPAQAQTVLGAMFAAYGRVVVKAEFGGGFSGGRIFLVRPIRANGATELRTVVKMAPAGLIDQEWQAYRSHIHRRWPKIAQVEGEPVVPQGSDWSGLRYHLVGEGVFEFQSLRQYCREATPENIRFVLHERLFKATAQVLAHHRTEPDLHLQSSYDAILPVNLLVKPASSPADSVTHLLTPATVNKYELKPGDPVCLEGFVVTRLDPQNRSVTLNLPGWQTARAPAYMLRLKPVEAIDRYQVGQVLTQLEGTVVETRAGRLEQEVRQAFGPGLDLEADTLTMPDGTALPNPLRALPGILAASRDVKVGTIHGDLNLENILVDPATRDVSLIDFAEAREDHLLHDFLRLETGVITKLLPEALHRANLGPGVIRDFYEALHRTATAAPQPALQKPFEILLTLRKAVRPYLFNPDDWPEYYQGLVVYLLGALRFKELEPLARQVAFWGAGVGMDLLKKPSSLPPPPPDPEMEEKMEALKQEMEYLKKALKELRLNLQLIQDDVRTYAVGQVPLYLKRQEMALKEQIQEMEDKMQAIEKQIAMSSKQ